jgi:hypothetical protein
VNYHELLKTVCLDNPKAKILFNHGYKDPDVNAGDPVKNMHEFYKMAAGLKNLYMETGGWCETNFEIAFEEGVRACNLMWGHDYGNVPQHIVRPATSPAGLTTLLQPLLMTPCGHTEKPIPSSADSMTGSPSVPTYQPDFYGWGLRTSDRVGDWLTQDEINLIMGGTAARLYKLPVPLPRLFPEARPDIFGDNWREDWYPFIPDEQIQDPEGFRIPVEKMMGHTK